MLNEERTEVGTQRNGSIYVKATEIAINYAALTMTIICE